MAKNPLDLSAVTTDFICNCICVILLTFVVTLQAEQHWSRLSHTAARGGDNAGRGERLLLYLLHSGLCREQCW